MKKEYLNQRLVASQGVSDKHQDVLVVLHTMMENLFSNLHKMSDVDIMADRRFINYTVESIEFEMQRFWKFPQSADYHTWWHKNPSCLCPTMDNIDANGTGVRYFNTMCPLHGGLSPC